MNLKDFFGRSWIRIATKKCDRHLCLRVWNSGPGGGDVMFYACAVSLQAERPGAAAADHQGHGRLPLEQHQGRGDTSRPCHACYCSTFVKLKTVCLNVTYMQYNKYNEKELEATKK